MRIGSDISASGKACDRGVDGPRAVRESLGKNHGLLKLGPLSARFERRTIGMYLIVLAGILAGSVSSLMIGDYGISATEVLVALFGTLDDRLAQYFVVEVRLPRVVAGILVGMCLGLSGTIFQAISGNPLGSPDIIGFTKGAATGALVAIILIGGGGRAVSVGAVVGGLITAAIVYGLSWRQGVSGFRFVLVGIGAAAILSAVNSLLIVKAPLGNAMEAASWLAGSLNASIWSEVLVIVVVLLAALPFLVHGFRVMQVLPFGDDFASGLGVRVERSRLMLIVLGIVLMAVATAITGPIGFIALAAPHLIKKITRTVGPALFGSALMGAFLVVLSDLVARRIFAPDELAVGIITNSIGGIYLIILLVLEWRKR